MIKIGQDACIYPTQVAQTSVEVDDGVTVSRRKMNGSSRDRFRAFHILVDKMARRWERRRVQDFGPEVTERLRSRSIAVALLATAAVMTAALSYYLFDTGTATPGESFPGDLTVAVAESAVTTDLRVRFRSGQLFGFGFEWPDPDPDPETNDDDDVDLALTISSAVGGERRIEWAILVDNYQLSDIRGEGVNSRNGEILIDNDGDSFGCLCQVIYGEAEVRRSRPTTITFEGKIAGGLSSAASGLTVIQIPSFQCGNLTKVSDLRFVDAEFGLSGKWHTPEQAKYRVELHSIPREANVTSVMPAANLQAAEPEYSQLQWSGSALPAARVEITNRWEQRRATGIVFMAGSLAGLATGLLVETVLRLPGFASPEPPPAPVPRKRRPLQQRHKDGTPRRIGKRFPRRGKPPYS